MDEFVLSADVGGTNIRVAVVDGTGTMHLRNEASTPIAGSPADIAGVISQLAEAVTFDLDTHRQPVIFGLAIPAVIDFETGRVSRSPNLPQLNGVEFGKIVGGMTGTGVVLENDATAAAIGEHWLGAASGAKDVVCITLGTGVGGGLILNGLPYSGADGTAGEIGHICVEPEGPPCGCGSRGCLEQFASATAIVRIYREKIESSGISNVSPSPELTAAEIFNYAHAGDEISLSVFRRVGYYLGIAFADLVNVLNPELIVITGGVSAAWPYFIERTEAEMKSRAFQQPAERVKIVPGLLGDDAGILGAAKMALDQ